MKVRKSQYDSFSTRTGEGEFAFLTALRAEMDNLRLASLGWKTNSVTNNFASIADGDFLALDVSCPGATEGDFAFVSLGVSAQGMIVGATVTSPDTVTVTVHNESGGAVDLASTTVSVAALPYGRAQAFGLVAQTTNDFASIANGAGASLDVTCTGAALGDFAVASVAVDSLDLIVNAQVTAADTVTVRLQNETGGAVDLASTNVRVMVCPQGSLKGLYKVAGVTNDFANLVDAAGATLNVACPGAAVGDFALASLSVDNVDMVVSAYVSAPNVVSVRVQNETGGAVDLASCVVRVLAIPSVRLVDRQFTLDANS